MLFYRDITCEVNSQLGKETTAIIWDTQIQPVYDWKKWVFEERDEECFGKRAKLKIYYFLTLIPFTRFDQQLYSFGCSFFSIHMKNSVTLLH